MSISEKLHYTEDEKDAVTVDSLETIAVELSRLRALKEYELGVLSTTPEGSEGDDSGIDIVAGGDHGTSPTDPGYQQKGTIIWHEDAGKLT